MRKLIFILIAVALCIATASATFNLTFDKDDEIHANQSFVQDPTGGASIPWEFYICSGFAGLILIVISLCRSKTQKMDYEINIVISVLAWPFVWYWTWGGLTSIDRVVGFAAAPMSDVASSSNEAAFMVQHIVYTPWVLGWIGVAGCVFAAFVTTLLIAQYGLFKENEQRAAEMQRQSELHERI